MYWGDFPLGETLNFLFTTRRSTGLPTVFAGTPALRVYEDVNLAQITAGVTVTVDHDAVVGLNRANIVATSGNGYESGKTYSVVVQAGTVDGTSVVGEVVGTFTIDRGAALRPTTAGRTLDVAATGEAGIDLDNTIGTLAAAQIATDALTAAKIATDAINKIARAIGIQTNTAFNDIKFLFVAASDHVTPVTGATGTAVTRSIDGGAFGAGTGTLAEIANGIYQYDASAADLNGTVIMFRFTATGGTPGAPDDRFLLITTVA